MTCGVLVFGKSWYLIKNNPIFGVGIGNFIIEISYLLTGYPVWMAEPVHNLFILVLVEIGIFGLLSFISFLYFIWKRIIRVITFWHYYFIFLYYDVFWPLFLDIRQVQVILFLFLGIILSGSIKKSQNANQDTEK